MVNYYNPNNYDDPNLNSSNLNSNPSPNPIDPIDFVDEVPPLKVEDNKNNQGKISKQEEFQEEVEQNSETVFSSSPLAKKLMESYCLIKFKNKILAGKNDLYISSLPVKEEIVNESAPGETPGYGHDIEIPQSIYKILVGKNQVTGEYEIEYQKINNLEEELKNIKAEGWKVVKAPLKKGIYQTKPDYKVPVLKALFKNNPNFGTLDKINKLIINDKLFSIYVFEKKYFLKTIPKSIILKGIVRAVPVLSLEEKKSNNGNLKVTYMVFYETKTGKVRKTVIKNGGFIINDEERYQINNALVNILQNGPVVIYDETKQFNNLKSVVLKTL